MVAQGVEWQRAKTSASEGGGVTTSQRARVEVPARRADEDEILVMGEVLALAQTSKALRDLGHHLLVRHGYPPAVIHKDEREKYLRCLERADGGDAGPLAELLARSVREGIYRFLMPALAGPLSVVPLAALATKDLSRYALVAAAQRGRLKAHKHGNGWYSTRLWVEDYKASRRQRAA